MKYAICLAHPERQCLWIFISIAPPPVCSRLSLEQPSSLLSKMHSYKHHNTVKYLIGITPPGTVCFISEGWRGKGRASDRHFTGNCNLLIPGDTILADRGLIYVIQLVPIVPHFQYQPSRRGRSSSQASRWGKQGK